MSTYFAVMLGINFFLLHGIENTNGGWLSSYAVDTKIANNQQANLLTTTFWLTYTIARYVSGFIHIKESIKLKRLGELGFASGVVCSIFGFMGQGLLAAILCAILQGIAVSGVYPLSLALPYEFVL